MQLRLDNGHILVMMLEKKEEEEKFIFQLKLNVDTDWQPRNQLTFQCLYG